MKNIDASSSERHPKAWGLHHLVVSYCFLLIKYFINIPSVEIVGMSPWGANKVVLGERGPAGARGQLELWIGDGPAQRCCLEPRGFRLPLGKGMTLPSAGG